MKLIALFPLLLVAAAPQEGGRHSGVAARINGEIITWDEVELKIVSVPINERTQELRRRILRGLAEEELFLQEARNYQIEVSESQVDADIEAERKKTSGPYTTQQFYQWINRELGYSISEYRAMKRRERTIATLMSRLATEPLRNPNPKLRLLLDFVSPEEMRDYFVKNTAQFKEIRQIDVIFLTLQFGPADKADKIRLAESIRRRVKEDSPLYAQALAHMDVNLMPMKNTLRMPAYENLAYEDAPFSDEVKKLLYETLKEGDLSEPVIDGNSVSLFHLRQRIVEKQRTFEEAQPFIRRQLELSKRRTNQKVLLGDLVKRSFVEPPDLFN